MLRKLEIIESYKKRIKSIINKRKRNMEITGWTKEETNEDFLLLEKKVARKLSKENRRKEIDRRNIRHM
jgi:hypothetical protein